MNPSFSFKCFKYFHIFYAILRILKHLLKYVILFKLALLVLLASLANLTMKYSRYESLRKPSPTRMTTIANLERAPDDGHPREGKQASLPSLTYTASHLKKNPVLIGSHLLVSSYRHEPSRDSIHGHNFVVINIYFAVTLRPLGFRIK